MHSGIDRSILEHHLRNNPIHCMQNFESVKPVIIIDGCVVKSWFTCESADCVSQTAKAIKMYFVLYFIFKRPCLA